jgi:hypothetical protein
MAARRPIRRSRRDGSDSDPPMNYGAFTGWFKRATAADLLLFCKYRRDPAQIEREAELPHGMRFVQ